MKRLYINSLLVLVLSLYCGYETILGLYQFLGILRFNHSIFALTGSFNNPGPYAGFLSVCISLLTLSICTDITIICYYQSNSPLSSIMNGRSSLPRV
jgi:hypothetical protein